MIGLAAQRAGGCHQHVVGLSVRLHDQPVTLRPVNPPVNQSVARVAARQTVRDVAGAALAFQPPMVELVDAAAAPDEPSPTTETDVTARDVLRRVGELAVNPGHEPMASTVWSCQPSSSSGEYTNAGVGPFGA